MLYIVATPIGNLKDITLRALDVLKSVDLILAEDTRQTKKLLMRYEINKPVQSYHQHSRLQKIDWILDLLQAGKNIALVTDSGTPGICDPGNQLIEYLMNNASNVIPACDVIPAEVEDTRQSAGIYGGESPIKLGMTSTMEITPIPGPCALIAALSVSGLPTDKFLFLGFPPAKRKRQKFFEQAINSKYTVVFYESCHRILRTLEDLGVILNAAERSEESRVSQPLAGHGPGSLRHRWSYGRHAVGRRLRLPQDDNTRQIVVCRELTKKFETIYRGSCEDIAEQLKKENHEPRGEFVVMVAATT